MKKVICIILVALMLPVALLSCAGRKNEREIEATIEEFCAALADNDLNTVLDYTEAELDSALTAVQKAMNSYEFFIGVDNFFGLKFDENFELEMLEIKILNEKATALVAISNGKQIVEKKNHKFTLKKNDDTWLISEVVSSNGPASGASVEERIRSFFKQLPDEDEADAVENFVDEYEDEMEEITEELTEGLNEWLREWKITSLSGEIVSIYLTEDDIDRGTWVVEFENISDACKGLVGLCGDFAEIRKFPEEYWIYYNLNVIRDGCFVIFGQNHGVNFMLAGE